MKLTDRAVRAAGPGKHGDGRGLMLVVAPSGSKAWKLRYQVAGRRRDMGLGSYPEVTLAQARHRALEARRLAKDRVDPIDERAKLHRASQPAPSFREIAALVIADGQAASTNAKVRYQIARHLSDAFCGPLLDRPVNEITTSEVARVLRPIWDGKPEVARKVYPLVRRVFDRARVVLKADHGTVMVDNPAAWTDMKAHGFTKPKALTRGRHPSLPHRLMAEFMTALRANDTIAARLAEYVVLTNVRAGAARQTRWRDLDVANGVWNVPVEHLKDRAHRSEPFRIPLSGPCIELLKALEPCRVGPLVFAASDPDKPLSDGAVAALFRRMNAVSGGRWKDEATGRPIVLHGFRATFRTWAEEVGRFAHGTIEEAMGHVIGSAAERAYRRTDVFELRRELMGAWAEQCAGQDGQ